MLVIILTLSVVMWLASLSDGLLTTTNRQPIPRDIPPAAAQQPPLIDTEAPGRTANQLGEWSLPIADQLNVEPQAIRAYANAELIAAQVWPECNLKWNTLAGIGWVETRHGTYTGKLFDAGRLNDDGVADPPIIGVRLDGSPGFAKIHDTDGGEFDGDKEYDRAIGPMQFLPESWKHYGRDGNGDGVADPQQIDDAALAAATVMCSGGRDMATEQDWRAAILGYNHSNDYVAKVRDAAANYALGQPAQR
ncbi:lytic murein transglycosylase [Corynebacterium aquatimens]|uniref:Membrane-bound lytic murein transglycosylase B n=1 Tax=Corynebacterium aquatimens TaxID=1190508 RepID=A0A931E3Z1_9CORY|nr:membrane-bound lytic murein transglycosylase B [Corynebacterium aquatimens]